MGRKPAAAATAAAAGGDGAPPPLSSEVVDEVVSVGVGRFTAYADGAEKTVRVASQPASSLSLVPPVAVGALTRDSLSLAHLRPHDRSCGVRRACPLRLLRPDNLRGGLPRHLPPRRDARRRATTPSRARCAVTPLVIFSRTQQFPRARPQSISRRSSPPQGRAGSFAAIRRPRRDRSWNSTREQSWNSRCGGCATLYSFTGRLACACCSALRE